MPVILTITWLLVAALEIILVSQPGGVGSQVALSASIIGLLLIMRLFRIDGRMRHVFLALGSVVVLRYAYWRTTSTLPPVNDLWSFVPGLLLYGAEMYSIVMLGLSLFVVSDPRKRKAAPAIDADTAPRVDVLVPSYNESADILALTLSAAKAMDYPAGKLTVTLLDDGATAEKLNSPDRKISAAARHRATELKALCKKLGVDYHARERNVHAKAGNLNGGLSVTSGELIVVFDADHAPERHFLTETVGYFAQDPKLFLVQTPHFFVNPDPVERNLRTFDHMPSENEMFYGRIQAGLDRWNASFFCGSAAVLRRKALEEAGGFAGITITEDAETALELHAKGWNSVYVDKPMVIGLQPETFASLVGQRSRWCRGMVQVLLLKNPLFKRGLSFAQRIGYLSSSLFWLFPFARAAFFVAPLLFILFNLKIYVSSMEEFFAYALTYLIASEIIRSSLYGKLRWPWISELYEYAQSVFLLPAIGSVIASPRKPTFNVTAKGDDVSKDRVSELSLPYFVIFLVSLLGMAVVIYRWQTEPEISGLLAVAGVWQFINLLIAGAGLGIVTERAERRGANRLPISTPVDLVIGADHYAAELEDVSSAGASVRLLEAVPALREHQAAVLQLVDTNDESAKARLPVTMIDIGDAGDRLSVTFNLQAQDYPMLAELMLSDMSTVRAEREQRRKYRGILRSTVDLALWAVSSPLSFFALLFAGAKEEPVVEETIKTAPRRSRASALKTKVDVA